MAWDIRGLIEGFYGPPWSWDDRVEVMRWCDDRDMTTYVYAPKDDPKHREQWREPYDGEELDGFRRLVDEGGLDLGFAISPGLSIDGYDDADRRILLAKVDQVVDLGGRLVCLALDDIPPRPGLGEEHAALVTWLGRCPRQAGPTACSSRPSTWAPADEPRTSTPWPPASPTPSRSRGPEPTWSTTRSPWPRPGPGPRRSVAGRR